jgi:hypothetical protein
MELVGVETVGLLQTHRLLMDRFGMYTDVCSYRYRASS